MAPLPPVTYFAVGAIVTIVSLLIPRMTIFLIVGVIFIGMGLLKLFLRKRVPVAEHRPRHTHHVHSPRNDTPNSKRCYACGSKNHLDANFCGHCGNKL